MKSKKTKLFLFMGIIILLLGAINYINYYNSNLIKLDYNDLIAKTNNKEDFILCVSASDCVHCREYKPKLKKIANSYDIKIYYVNIDEFSDVDYEIFKRDFSFDGGTPTTIFFKNGEEKTTANRISGNEKTDKIISKLKSNGYIN